MHSIVFFDLCGINRRARYRPVDLIQLRAGSALWFTPPEYFHATPSEVIRILQQAGESLMKLWHAIIREFQDTAADARHDLVDEMLHVKIHADLPVLFGRTEMDLAHD